jgi:DEAD/DEAH box helicase domain-containing protein
MKQIFLDVETQKTFDEVGGYYPEKLGISFVGVIQRHGFPESGAIKEVRHQFFEADLDKLWPVLEQADVIIGFNLIEFDLPTFKPYYNGDIQKLPSLDLLVKIKEKAGHRISLDAVAKETLGTKKIGNGLDAIKYYHEQDWDSLAKYCMKDVEITRDVYDFGRQKGFVKYTNRWNNLIELEVDFQYSLEEVEGLQMTLV